MSANTMHAVWCGVGERLSEPAIVVRSCLFSITIVVASVVGGCSPPAPNNPHAAAPPTVETAVPPQNKPAARVPTTGAGLYAQHCAACHGLRGDGKGIAAAYLFPKPRDFRSGRFRLISASNGVPSVDDLDAVLRRGMPGSAMPPWPQLSAADRKLIVDEVLLMRREGVVEQFILEYKESEGADAKPDPQDVATFVQEQTTPQPPAPTPKFGPLDEQSVARGREVYAKQGCVSCHGATGKGDGQQVMVDAEGLPTRPRDFTLGIFKGGHDPTSVYRRIALGMPGTPMPSSANLSPEQIQDLTQFTLSLSTEEARQATILNRTRINARYVAALPAQLDAPAWDAVPAQSIHMAPLWWRNDADPGLEVRALHDGQAIAFRLRWKDAQADRHAAQTQAFKDGAALELYRGPAEPFVGMGGAGAPVDAWMWDADRQGPSVNVEDVYPRTVVDIYPLAEPKVETPEYGRPGAKTANQPEIAFPARASGNPNARGQKLASGGSTLEAAGPGTVTFRPRVNQRVTAIGQWTSGSWTVVFVRALAATKPGEGLSLEPGGAAVVAFAVWDGSQRDRDGQKLISIWQDLTLESVPK